MEACFRGHLELAKLLVSRGDSWIGRDHCGFSALHYAVDGGHLPVVSHILSEGVPADETGDNTLSGWTPLMRIGTYIDTMLVNQVCEIWCHAVKVGLSGCIWRTLLFD